jgi:peptidoglycan/xylan/chitin deacetylase (PgdA/CDA1 family)
MSFFCLILILFTAVSADNSNYSIEPPGDYAVEDAPLFISFGWDDNAYSDGMDWILDFTERMKNQDGSAVRGTFFLTTSFGTADNLLKNQTVEGVRGAWKRAYEMGNELANHTVNHEHNSRNKDKTYWINAIGAATEFLVDSLSIPADSVFGFRTPFLEYGDGTMQALEELNFRYDCSVECGFEWYTIRKGYTDENGNWIPGLHYSTSLASGGKRHWWPYTMDDGVPEGTSFYSSHMVPGMWQIPVNVYQNPPADFTDFENISDDMQVGTITGFDFNVWNVMETKDEALTLFKFIFHQRLQGNRAPLTLNLHSDYYSEHNSTVNDPNSQDYFTVTLEERREVLEELIEYMIQFQDVRLVPYATLIDWLEEPVHSDEYVAPDRFGLADNGGGTSLTGEHSQGVGSNRIALEGRQLTLDIAAKGDYSVDILNMRGQRVASVFNGFLSAGSQTLNIHTGDLSKGYYIIRLQGEQVVKTMELIR